MAYTYSEYNNKFRCQAASDGFPYTFRQTLSVVPGALGHLLDTLLGLDGLLGDDKDNYAHGPIGAFPVYLLYLGGTILGYLLQFVFSLPSYLGHYLLDKPLNFLFNKLASVFNSLPLYLMPFDKIMLNTDIITGKVGNFLYNLPTGQSVPEPMRGLFGFILGIVPELTRYAINRMGATFTSVVKWSTDHICDGIRAVYAFIGALLFGKKLEPAYEKVNSSEDSSAEDEPRVVDPQANSKVRRIRRKKDRDEEILNHDKELQDAIENKINLFAALGITPMDYHDAEDRTKFVDGAFRKRSLDVHSDKLNQSNQQTGQTDNTKAVPSEWDKMNLAKKVLKDQDKARIYLEAYNKANLGANPNALFSAANTASSSAGSTQTQTQGLGSQGTKRRIIKRPS